jgi:hypothetical protein
MDDRGDRVGRLGDNNRVTVRWFSSMELAELVDGLDGKAYTMTTS